MALFVHKCVTPNWPLPSSLPIVYVALTSSIGRPRTGPIAAGFEGFEVGGVTVGGGFDVVVGAVVGFVELSLLSFAWLLLPCWLASPLSLAAAESSAGPSATLP